MWYSRNDYIEVKTLNCLFEIKTLKIYPQKIFGYPGLNTISEPLTLGQ